MSGARKTAKRTRKSPQELLDAIQQRLDATPERLARAREAGQTPTRDADRTGASSIRSTPCAPTGCSRRPIPSSTTSAGWSARLCAAPMSAPGSISCARSRPTARLDRLRNPLRPASVRDCAPCPRQIARGRGPGRSARLADRHPHRHRRRGRARMPQLRPRARHHLARRRGCLRPPAHRARHARRAHGRDGEAGEVRVAKLRSGLGGLARGTSRFCRKRRLWSGDQSSSPNGS